MALIRCPECGKMISERAEMCPHCGYKPGTGAGSAPAEEVVFAPVTIECVGGSKLRQKEFKVYIDGAQRGVFRTGESIEVELAPGSHSVRIRDKSSSESYVCFSQFEVTGSDGVTLYYDVSDKEVWVYDESEEFDSEEASDEDEFAAEDETDEADSEDDQAEGSLEEQNEKEDSAALYEAEAYDDEDDYDDEEYNEFELTPEEKRLERRHRLLTAISIVLKVIIILCVLYMCSGLWV